MKKRLEEGLLGIGAGDQIGRQSVRPLELHLGSLPRHVAPGGIAPALPPEATDGVEVLESEAERIDDGVAALAGRGARLEGDALAGGETGMEVGGERGHCLGRGLENIAEDPPR